MKNRVSCRESSLGDSSCLIYLDALERASQRLKDARLAYARAALDLTVAREKLEQAVDQAFTQQSFSPIEALVREEESALKVYESAVAQLARAEERYVALRAALADEQALTLAGPLPRQQLH